MPENAVKQDVHHPIVKQLAGYKKQLILVTVAVFALLLIYAVVSSWQQSAEDAAWKDIFVATYTAKTQNKPLPEELAKAIKEAGGARAVFYAQMLRGSVLGSDITKKEELEKAAEAYADFVEKFPEHKFIGQVRVDYGTVLANLGKYAEAHDQYRFVIDNGPAYMEGEALLFNALVLEKEGKDKEALAGYSKVMESNKQVVLGDIIEYASFARARLLKSVDTAEAVAAEKVEVKPAAKDSVAEKKVEEKQPAAAGK